MTGIAIVFYLNQYPNQPRERDYAYAASFYFYSVWIGLGVLALFEVISKIIKEKIAAPLAGGLCIFAVPVIMGAENWDDHDRSGRYLARDVAFNYLNSCAPGAILFTNGDNDTFPLWYAQEVEGKRTDIPGRQAHLLQLGAGRPVQHDNSRLSQSFALNQAYRPPSVKLQMANCQLLLVTCHCHCSLCLILPSFTANRKNRLTRQRLTFNDFVSEPGRSSTGSASAGTIDNTPP